MTTIEQKETEILATVRTNTLASLETMYRDFVKFDDIFNLKCELGSELSRITYRVNNQKSKMDEKDIEYQNLKDINGSNINSVKASFQGQETFAQQLGRIEWSVERMMYTLEILETKYLVTKEFYERVVGEKYVPYSSGKVKDTKKLQAESKKGKEWLAKNNHELPSIIEGSELIPAIAE